MARRSFVYNDRQFNVSRGVFDPVRHLSGLAFAKELSAAAASLAPTAQTALDVGTGCGLLAATLAQQGLLVVATDVSAAAVACASQNCRGLKVDVRHGDMFEPVLGERFDLVVVNPPYEREVRSWRRSNAFTSPDFLERFAAGIETCASMYVLGFPADESDVLRAAGLDVRLWRSVPTRGRALGLFVPRSASG